MGEVSRDTCTGELNVRAAGHSTEVQESHNLLTQLARSVERLHGEQAAAAMRLDTNASCVWRREEFSFDPRPDLSLSNGLSQEALAKRARNRPA